MTKKPKAELFKVAIIGMGEVGLSLARMFFADPEIKLVGVSNRRQDLPGISWAKEKGLLVTNNYKTLLERDDLDIVFDATGNPEVEAYLTDFKRNGLEIVKGAGAKMMWKIVEHKEAMEREAQKALSEQKFLHDVGLTLGVTETSDHALKLIVRAAMDVLDMPSGAAALFDEENGLMRTVASIDLEEDIRTPRETWEIHAGSLTGHVLSNSKPTVIEDIDSEQRFNTSQLKSQGIKSLISVTLRSEGKIVGILFVRDCKLRRFTRHEKELISLLGTMAASAVQKLLMLERAEEMAITDELTKLYNHRYFMRAFSSELKRAERFKEEVAICLVDVDHFKRFNDTHGHQQGNEVLLTLAELMKKNVRNTDILARYGGEEFVIILPNTSKKSAVDPLERLRVEVEKYPFQGLETQNGAKLTISLGLAGYPEDCADANLMNCLIDMADKAMYVSKSKGRNRITLFSENLNLPV